MRKCWLCVLVCLSASVGRADRDLSFPTDYSLGVLSVSDGPINIDGKQFIQCYFFDGWRSLGPARGEVTVSEGQSVWLSLDLDCWLHPQHLAALTQLGPDDLYGLSSFVSRSGVLKPNDRCMPYIAHLTGLRVLQMGSTNITNAGAKYLERLRHLEWLV